MIERFVDTAAVRACAELNAPRWAELCAHLDQQKPVSIEEIETIAQSLLDAGISALPLLIREAGQLMVGGFPRASFHDAQKAIEHQFVLLAKCDIRPSLYMYPLAAAMATTRGAEPPPEACFFLPVVPQLSGGGAGGADFFSATKTHLANFNAGMLRFLKGDTAAADDIRFALLAIKHRQPRDPYFSPIAIGAAFLSAIADKVLPLDADNRMLFSRIGAVVKAAMTETPLHDHSVCSRLAFAITRCTGPQKRVELLVNQLDLKHLLSTEAPKIGEFPPAEMFAACFNEAAEAWKAYTERGVGKQQVLQTVDMLRLISGENADLKKLAEAFKAMVAAATGKHYEAAREYFPHITQFMARYFDAVETRDSDIVARVAEEEWGPAQDLAQFGAATASRSADTTAQADVAREAASDLREARTRLDAGETEAAVTLLKTVKAVIAFIGLTDAAATVDLIVASLGSEPDTEHSNDIDAALDVLGRYLDTVYLRHGDAAKLLAEIAERYLTERREDLFVERASDREMFEIFLEEAREVVDHIMRLAPSDKPVANAQDMMALRRAFHTLKGSARMVGLEKLGGMMYDLEKIFDAVVALPPPYATDLNTVARDSARFAMMLCEQIHKTGEAPFNPGLVGNLIDKNKAQYVRS
jgi:HPt (histidine-containing phosphotransfer) domain-containing protein